ncbi:Stk1 family PASTA domain-containing Ser/Thr kinase [Corynebacterium glucuronolyticum]|uniref:non-specific serine/threonine protein kinase n=1 Tax=Corynebacterium glucuronolyticum TaxID=39791 RepID=A0A7T4ECZ3_9CORY|nr:Stk1 family PASTA domain-containing Ser/Thr kinase [Corynebacterium glucuronolyticum]QQB45412.1 Stk1 family PASTA domain-containing Ser/Thr kinase [Corynebacterium glucuronolyticum]
MNGPRNGELLDGRYRVERPIARGGMSTVYRCVDTRLGRNVAAKVLSPELSADPAARSHFKREARAMAQLSHPCLVNVYDTGSDGAYDFLIMELITGGTLRELTAERGPMPPHAATAVMIPVLTALSLAHRAGMVHRDIKPDNILINGDHQVKLSDFGLVRAASTSVTGSHKITGTVAYLSPEQVTGEPIGPASDVYSAGIVLFELLTGRTPFSGDDVYEHARARVTGIVPPPSTLIDGVPHLFDHLIATATAREPEERFSDAQEFLDALEDVARELQLPEYEVPVPQNTAAKRAGSNLTVATDVLTRTGHETAVLPTVTAPAQNPETAVMPASQEHNQLADYVQAPEPASQPEPETQPEPVSNRSTGRFIVWFVVVVLIAAAVGVGGWWFGSGRYGELPDITGLNQDAAYTQIDNAGFEPVVIEVYDNNVPKGQATGTDPLTGEREVRGRSVVLYVSLGKPTIPALPSSQSPGEYEQQLKSRTLTPVIGEETYSDTVPEGLVAAVNPQPGTEVAVGSSVTIHLSKGKKPVTIPDLVGKKLEDAIDALKKAGLDLGETTKQFSADVAGGSVIASSPKANETTGSGSSVDLVVSNALTVPDVTGKTVAEGIETLKKAGFEGTADSQSGIIEAVYPKPGTRVEQQDNKVDLVVSDKVRVPDLTGLSREEIDKTLRSLGLSAKLYGISGGKAYKQTPTEGTSVEKQDTLRVWLK